MTGEPRTESSWERESRIDREIKMSSDVARLGTTLDAVLTRIDRIEKDMRTMTAMANRWKGATVVLLALGSAAGWLSTVWAHLTGHLS
jgi:hypothetical protein